MTPVQFVKGVGPKRAVLLEKLGLRTARDLLFHFPRDYQDMSELRPIAELEEGATVSVAGKVDEIELRNTGPGRSILGVLIRQGTHYLRAIWFNQPFMEAKFAYGDRVLFSGTVKRSGIRWEMTHPQVQPLAEDEEPPPGRILATYPLTEGIRQQQMRRMIHSVAREYVHCIEEVLPSELRERHQLAGIQDALSEIHIPSGSTALAYARRRFTFQELFVMQLALAMRKWRMIRDCPAASLRVSGKIDARIRRLFPFQLTEAQNSVIHEITGDMAKEHAMNRLLQGDVGSGKTVVAQYAMLLAVAHGNQAVLMAPTEVLARQHAQTLATSLANSKARIGLLVGSMGERQRRTTLDAIASGAANLIVGTQSVLHESIAFQKLGLVVIDEQHKFGVRQRAQLRRAGLNPHYLVMTATPIPRTVSMTLFGDLELSTLREAPPGRQTVHTYIGSEQQREEWWSFFRKKLSEGRQGYVITPLVDAPLVDTSVIDTPLADEPTSGELASVEREFERLANGELEAFRIDLVHGQQSATEKDAVMQSFRNGRTQVLVATSVVEVGVDIANATLMTIENGERFGLAQLHQLRGRVSRGTFPGYVCVFANCNSAEASWRLDAFHSISDGFELAEKDFLLRGPGDLFGLRQHGMPPLRIANLQRDTDLLLEARAAAQEVVSADPDLLDPAMKKLRRMVVARYGRTLELGDVG